MKRVFHVVVAFFVLLLLIWALVRFFIAPYIGHLLPLGERDLLITEMPVETSDGRLLTEIEAIYHVHFIDAGQGDAILIQTPAANVLVDGGERGGGVVDYLLGLAIDTLHMLVATHPHADHIGALPEVLSTFPVLEVIDPGVVHSTRLFREYLSLIDSLEIPYTMGRAGMRRELGGEAFFDIVHPEDPVSHRLNDASVVILLHLHQIRVLLTGDIEARSEAELLLRLPSIQSHVLKVAHHGSNTSTTQSFLDAVAPEVAVIFCADGNKYGFPHQEVLFRLSQHETKVLRTDHHGSIVLKTDGIQYYFDTELSGMISRGSGQGGSFGPVDINTASLEELITIIHVGPARAGEIMSRRPFSSLDELITIPGIDSKRLEEIKRQNIAFVNRLEQ